MKNSNSQDQEIANRIKHKYDLQASSSSFSNQQMQSQPPQKLQVKNKWESCISTVCR